MISLKFYFEIYTSAQQKSPLAQECIVKFLNSYDLKFVILPQIISAATIDARRWNEINFRVSAHH